MTAARVSSPPAPPMIFVAFSVPGRAAPQGSKRHVGHGIMVESSARLRPWRAAVTAAAIEARDGAPPITGPVYLRVDISFPRPAGHFGTGRNAGKLRPSAPYFAPSRAVGDLSKLIRAVEDAITDAGLWRDDSQVVVVTAVKRHVADESEEPRTRIRIEAPPS